MQAIEVEGEYEFETDNLKLELDCDSCLKCRNTCPTSAINEAESFDYKKCLRHLQENPELMTQIQAKKLQNKLLGCDICQVVCPYNDAKNRVEVPENIKELLKLENLLEVLKDKAKTKEIFTPLIGSNYARVRMLLPVALLVAGNSGDKQLLEKVEYFKNHELKIVRKNTEYAINNLLKDKK